MPRTSPGPHLFHQEWVAGARPFRLYRNDQREGILRTPARTVPGHGSIDNAAGGIILLFCPSRPFAIPTVMSDTSRYSDQVMREILILILLTVVPLSSGCTALSPELTDPGSGTPVTEGPATLPVRYCRPSVYHQAMTAALHQECRTFHLL